MPPKKAAPAPAAPPPPKSAFFKQGGHKTTAAPASAKAQNTFFPRKPQFQPRRSFLYDKYTDEPYAEWIGNEAVCLETGEVLFVSKRGEDDDWGSEGGGFVFPQKMVKFDYTPPVQKHPKDPSISSQDLIDKGILTLEDFSCGRAGLSVEAFNKYMHG